MKIQKIGLDR